MVDKRPHRKPVLLSDEELKILENARKTSGQTMSGYLRVAALEKAHKSAMEAVR